MDRRHLFKISGLMSLYYSIPASSRQSIENASQNVFLFNSISDFILRLEGSDFSEFSLVLTYSYHSGSNIGGNIYELIISTSLESHKVTDFGKKIYVGTKSGSHYYLRSLSSDLNVFQFGARGDGITDDTIYIKSYVLHMRSNNSLTINLGENSEACFIVSETIYFHELNCLEILGSGVIKRIDFGLAISSGSRFWPLIRIHDIRNVFFHGQWSVDGNRDNQEYSVSIFRGSYCFRHNGDVEIINYEPSVNIRIENYCYLNSYLNSLVLWNCTNAKVSNVSFIDTTWNGISGTSLTNFQVDSCCFIRCGASDIYNTNEKQGDRAGIQLRELPQDLVFSMEGFPEGDDAFIKAGKVNTNITIANSDFDSCGVESIYVRAGFQTLVKNNFSKNCGFKRLNADRRYFPAHIWLESGGYLVMNNRICQDVVYDCCMKPDAIRVTSLVGDATRLFPMRGKFYSRVTGNDIMGNDNSRNESFLNHALRTNGLCDFSSNNVIGTSNYVVWLQNSDSFDGDLKPRDFKMTNCFLTNVCTEIEDKAIIHVTLFGNVAGKVENVQISSNTVLDTIPTISYNENTKGFVE